MVKWGDVPTWMTAGVALVALVGAWLAYRTQSHAVEKQAEQVELQRIQLEDQRRATEAQLEAIRLQATVIADQNQLQERQQADCVDVSARSFDGAQARVLPADKGEPVHIILVFNGSKRPIREVSAKVEVILAADRSVRHEKLADVYGALVFHAYGTSANKYIAGADEEFVLQARASTVPVLRAGQIVAFAWGFTTAMYREVCPSVRFTDDAGLRWEITPELHLRKLGVIESEEW